MKPVMLKVFGVVFTIFLIVIMVLFALGRISTLIFWVIILLGAIVAYWVVPRLRKE